MSTTLPEALLLVEQQDDYKVLKRVPETLADTATDAPFTAAIIDLETTGLSSDQHEIIEIGTLVVGFDQTGINSVIFTDNQLQQPTEPISQEITDITGITNDDVAGCAIDWQLLEDALRDVNLVICHNARFDRQFLEKQTPDNISQLFQQKAFGCSASDIPWRSLGFEGAKLEYLNLKMGYFYDGHRALVDCWATLNILLQTPAAFDHLKQSVRQKQHLICAINSDFDKKDILKQRGYRWSDGAKGLPKAWYTVVAEQDFEPEMEFLQQQIYSGREVSLPQQMVNAFNRYSGREYQMSASS